MPISKMKLLKDCLQFCKNNIWCANFVFIFRTGKRFEAILVDVLFVSNVAFFKVHCESLQ